MLPELEFIKTKENNWVLLKSPDHISEYIKKNGFWGQKETIIAKAFVLNKKNVNILDIGANIGGFTLPMAKFISKNNGKVFSFEPQRIIFQQLCANIILNRLDNVFTYNFALGDKVQKINIPELDLWRSENSGGLSIDTNIRKKLNEDSEKGLNFKNFEKENRYNVEQVTLDSLEFSFVINFVKVDIEGYELEFLNGANKTLKKNDFPPIVYELWSSKSWYKEKADKINKLLENWGYNLNIFGKEILAQHPNHPTQCKITRVGDRVDLKII